MVAQPFAPSKVDTSKTESEDTWLTEPEPGKPKPQSKSMSQMEKRKTELG